MASRHTGALRAGNPLKAMLKGIPMTVRVAVAAVTFNRQKELSVLLDAIKAQSAAVDTIGLVDSGTDPARPVAVRHTNVDYVRSEANLGAAGGFALPALKAVAVGAKWVRLMAAAADPTNPGSPARPVLARRAPHP